MFFRFLTLALALLVAGSFGQVLFEDKIEIDDFSVSTPIIVISTPAGTFSQIDESRVTQGAGIIGGERDLQLSAVTGSNAIFSTAVTAGSWIVSTPIAASGFSFMQYDGLDDSIDLDNTGLAPLNLLADLTFAFRIELSVDIDTEVTVAIYSNGEQCARSIDVDGQPGVFQDFTLEFADFAGNCDFGDVGAIEIFVEAFDNVDITLRTFVTFGEVPPDPSPTPSPTRSESPSADPIPSQSPTPSPSPSPEVADCVCDCPAFRCGMVYAVPHDDDDNIDDDTHDDDDLIYVPVYYGPVDDDFDYILGDDDEDEFISLHGGLTVNHLDDDDTESSASALSASLLVVLIAALI